MNCSKNRILSQQVHGERGFQRRSPRSIQRSQVLCLHLGGQCRWQQCQRSPAHHVPSQGRHLGVPQEPGQVVLRDGPQDHGVWGTQSSHLRFPSPLRSLCWQVGSVWFQSVYDLMHEEGFFLFHWQTQWQDFPASRAECANSFCPLRLPAFHQRCAAHGGLAHCTGE